MSGRNRGIVIELTALLDVILIMLFWVMMSSQSTAAEAEDRAAQAEESLAAEQDRAQEEISAAQEEAQKKVEEAYATLEKAEGNAVANQQALDEYAQGKLVTLRLTRGAEGGRLKISFSGTEVTVDSGSESAADGIVTALESLGIGQTDVVLCAVMYDGDSVLYRDVENITSAVNEVCLRYTGVYCTYLNTSG